MTQPLRPEVLTTAPQRRANRLNMALAATAAAIGGAVGTSAVVFSVLPFLDRAPTPVATPAPAIELPRPAPTAPVSVAPPIVRPLEIAPIEAPATGTPTFIQHADAPRFVLAATVEDDWLKTGAPSMVWEDNSTYVLEQAVVASKIPSHLTAMVGRRAAVFDDKGHQCSATVGALSSTLMVVEDFQDKPKNASERKDAWGYGEPALVARLETLEGTCEGTLVAAVIVDGEASPSDIQRATTVDLEASDPLAVSARKAFAATPEYAALAAAYAKDGGKGEWIGTDAMHTATLIGDKTRGIAFVSTSVGGCGSFEASLTTAFEVRDGVLGSRLAVPSDVEVAELAAAADTNGDDLPELFIHRFFWNTEVWTSAKAGYTSTQGAEVVAHICPC